MSEKNHQDRTKKVPFKYENTFSTKPKTKQTPKLLPYALKTEFMSIYSLKKREKTWMNKTVHFYQLTTFKI